MHKIYKPIEQKTDMKVLMVCLGNICRSPIAQGILQDRITKLQLDWEVDSAGTSNFHAGEKPDTRSICEARKYGIDISKQKSRQITVRDIREFDLILAMDSSNYKNIINLCATDEQVQKVKMILNYSHPNENRNVPDPYYENGFDKVYVMLEEAIDQLLVEVGVWA